MAEPRPTAPPVENRRSNIDGVRLLAAAGVLIGHGFDLRLGGTIRVSGIPLSSMCVMVFFVISGWLITASWERDPRPLQYLRNRVLRIFPALIAVVGATTLVLGPAITTLSRSAYFANPDTWRYLRNAVLVTEQPWLPGVFTTNPYPDVVNGSLWTLPVEFSCYLAVPFLCVLPVRLRLPAAIVASVAAMAAFYRLPSQLSVIGTPVQLWLMLVSFFAAGAALRSVALLVGHQRWLRLDVALLLIVGETFMLPVRPSWTTDITLLVLPYLVMSFSLASTPVLRRASRFGDFSYGVYLWAFPVQQFVIMKRVYPPMWVDLPLVAAITIPIAVVSWRLVEKPALSLKRAGTRPAHRATREMSYAKSAEITNG